MRPRQGLRYNQSLRAENGKEQRLRGYFLGENF